MSTVTSEVLIAGPVHEVFAVASDWSQWDSWFAGTSHFRAVTSQTRGTGARYAYRVIVLGIPVPVETEIRDFLEDGGWQGVSCRGPRHRTTWRFTPEGESTRFRFSMEYEIPLLPAFLERRLVRPVWQRLVEQSTQNLKRRIESSAATSVAGTASPAGPPSR